MKRLGIILIFLTSASFLRGQDLSFGTGNDFNSKIESVELFPNPAVDFINVKIKDSELNNTQIELRSMIGNRVNIDLERISNKEYRVNLEGLSTGYYFLVVKDDFARFKTAIKFLKR